MAKIQVILSGLVQMANNSIANSRMELTPWDLRLLQLSPIQRGLLFRKPKSQEFEFKTFINHLKDSLTRTLDFFPPLTGRLGVIKNDDNTSFFFLDCNNTGVEFTHAIACNVFVSDILGPTYVPEIVSSFFPLNGLSNIEGISKPLLGVQITELVDGYFIALAANHAATDGISFWHFFNSWSEISRGFESISKNPIFERPKIFDNNDLVSIPPMIKEDHENNSISSTPLLERVFHFSKENVAKLKTKANFEAGSNKISSLQALSAHLWRFVVRNRRGVYNHGLDHIQDQICSCMLIVGARPRIPLPEGYFGNAIYPARFATSEAELLQNGLGWAALKLNELVSWQTRGAVIEFVEEWVKNPSVVRKGINTFAMTSSPWHNVYGNDFGWGKPVAVRSGAAERFDGMMTVFTAPAECGGGVHVMACLDPLILQAMGEDAEFMEAVTI